VVAFETEVVSEGTLKPWATALEALEALQEAMHERGEPSSCVRLDMGEAYVDIGVRLTAKEEHLC